MRLLKRVAKKIYRVTSAKLAPLNRKLDPASNFYLKSYAQEGEDIILNRIFEWKRDGFYVDVGAHHPHKYSNTYFFYLRGWRGINIDPLPGIMGAFNKLRPQDINLELAVSSSKEKLIYNSFNEPAINGFSKELSKQRDNYLHFKLVSQRTIETHTLSEILATHLPPNKVIDFLSIDVEGLDYAVLKSNDWTKYRPTVVLVEDLELHTIEDVNKSQTILFMRSCGYVPLCKTPHTVFFIEEERLKISPAGIGIDRTSTTKGLAR